LPPSRRLLETTSGALRWGSGTVAVRTPFEVNACNTNRTYSHLAPGVAAPAPEIFTSDDLIATRMEEDVEDVPATDIKDLVRFELGISVPNSPARFTAAGASTGRDGNSGFNIRGLEGNTVDNFVGAW